MHHTNSLRIFIRECLKDKSNKRIVEGAVEDFLGIFTPTVGPSGYPQPSLAQQIADSDINLSQPKGSFLDRIGIIGKKFSLEEGGDPDFTVFGDNHLIDKTIIMKYSNTKKSDADLLKLTGAKPIYYTDELAKSIAVDKRAPNGWILYQYEIQDFVNEFTNASERSQRSGYLASSDDKKLTGFFIIDRVEGNFKNPTYISTEEGLDKLSKLQCTLSTWEVITYIKDYMFSDPTGINFARAALCCYQHAGSMKGTLIAAAVGALIGLPFEGVGAIPGAIAGAATADVVLRSVVAYWAAKNGKNQFLAANVILIILNFAFAVGETAKFGQWSLKFRGWFAGMTSSYAGRLLTRSEALYETNKLSALLGAESLEILAKGLELYGLTGGLHYMILQLAVTYLPASIAESAKNIDAQILINYLLDPASATNIDGTEIFKSVIDKYPRK